MGRTRRQLSAVHTKAVAPIIDVMGRAQRTLDDIKHLAGSDAAVLVAWGDRLEAHAKMLNVLSVPDELKPAHALLSSAVNLAETASRPEGRPPFPASFSSPGMRLLPPQDQ